MLAVGLTAVAVVGAPAVDPVIVLMRQRVVELNTMAAGPPVLQADAQTAYALPLVTATGTFSDINYTSQNAGMCARVRRVSHHTIAQHRRRVPTAAQWQPANHTTRLLWFARSYVSPASAFFNSSTLAAKALPVLQWWAANHPTAANWWYNQCVGT